MSGPLRQIRVSDQVTKYIQDYIAANGLRPGDELPSESELARRLGVNRPTIREATNALAGIGIINVSSGRAPTVGAISETALTRMLGHGLVIAQIDTLQTLQVRRFIEERAAGLAAANRSDEDVAELRDIAAGLRKNLGLLESFSELDIAFHKTIARASGNPLVRIIVEGIADVALESSRSGLRAVRTRAEWKRIVVAHESVAEAIAEQDAPAAEPPHEGAFRRRRRTAGADEGATAGVSRPGALNMDGNTPSFRASPPVQPAMNWPPLTCRTWPVT